MPNKASINAVQVYGDFVVTNNNGEVIITGLFDRSRIKLRSATAWLGQKMLHWNWDKIHTKEDGETREFMCFHFPVALGKGRDKFYYALCISKSVGERYLVTTKESLYEDFYNFLLKKTKLPYLREWMPALVQIMSNDVVFQERVPVSPKYNKSSDGGAYERSFMLHGRRIALKDLMVYDCGAVTDGLMKEVVGKALQSGAIRIANKPQKPLEFKDFDEYIVKYGGKMVKHLEDTIEPLVSLKSTVKGLALKEKYLYPPQAACVEGIKALRRAGVSYAVLNEGMGVGKTLQSVSAVESYCVEEYLQKHPEHSLRDVYADENLINYRAIIICPGHLVEKWKSEIEEEIPYARAEILHGGIDQLIRIREQGKPKGKEYFIISKDFAKLGAEQSPIPTQVKMRPVRAQVCADCLDNFKVVYRKMVNGKGVCSDCGGNRFVPHDLPGFGTRKGLICPFCGELLLDTQVSPKTLAGLDDKNPVLSPGDFAKHNASNAYCYHCGNSMWGVHVKPLKTGTAKHLKEKPPKWRKISFYKNARAKTRETIFVMRGKETEFAGRRGYRELPAEYGPRKVAPAHYIKKYLKGAFDFCILDEAHKFEGAGTAQANAAQALVKASKFTMALTGTISNGTAASFFYLLWMLEPKRMVEKGYRFTTGDLNRFCQLYGCVETMYEVSENDSGAYNSSSRGRQIGSPKIKPGISPRVYVDFLMDRSLMLDITDLSKYLPPLHEYVRLVELPDDVRVPYTSTLDALKASVHSDEGRASLGVMLQFGLSYPDKPYGRSNIMSAMLDGMVLAGVENVERYENELLPKEQELVDIINQEMSEGRNAFVYASFTGEAETNVTERLKSVIERKCSLKGRVAILQSSSPAPSKREEWIKKKAAEGMKVIICNPKVVETGLDFCFTYQGGYYNYPTLIFYQMGYEMSVIWQASRRGYRLCQKVECRNYYLAYEGTLQAAALEIMAKKQVATSAIQGKFSTEGLSSMARGVDTRTQLAAAMSRMDMSDRKTLSNMFDVLNKSADEERGDGDEVFVRPKTFYELLGIEKPSIEEEQFDLFSLSFEDLVPKNEAVIDTVATEETVEVTPVPDENNAADDAFAAFMAAFGMAMTPAEEKPVQKPKKRIKAVEMEGQQDLFSLFV